MEAGYNGADRRLAYLFEHAKEVSFEPSLTAGTAVGTLTIDGEDTVLYAPTGGSSGDGHTIQDADGTELTQRTVLQFGGTLQATDDSTNEKTVVTDEAEEIEWSVWNAMTEAEQDTYSAGKKLNILNAPLMQAEDVEYDPTDSGLTATDVQAAVDEIAGRHLEWVTVATGTAGDTNATQLAALGTAFTELSTIEKNNSRLYCNGAVLILRTTGGVYCGINNSLTGITSDTARITSPVYYYNSKITASATTFTDSGDKASTPIWRLQVLRLVD